MQITPLQKDPPRAIAVEWLTLEEAAKELGKSVAMVRVYVKNGVLKSKREKGPKGHEIILIHAGSVAGMPLDNEQRSTARNGLIPVRKVEMQREPGSSTGYPSVGVPVFQPSPNAFMTLDEAAAYIQLPKSHLEKLIKTSMLRFHDVGPRPGGRYRVTRQDLDKL